MDSLQVPNNGLFEIQTNFKIYYGNTCILWYFWILRQIPDIP